MKRWSWLLAAAVAACGGKEPVISTHGFLGTELSAPVPKPDYLFTDSRGNRFPFDSATAGKVTLLLFGYVNCPDVCPVHLANLAAVLDKMPEEVQRQVIVVFVTTDPARDSASALDHFVRTFDPSFIALRADDSVVTAAERTVQLPPTERGKPDKTGAYVVGHGAAVVAFTRDGKGRVMYGAGTRQQDWAHDLPLLVNY